MVWNGPMGVFEWPAYAGGTEAVGRAVLAQLDSLSNMGAAELKAQRADRFYAIGRLGVSSNPAH